MACRTCDQTMQKVVGNGLLNVFHCPNCGTMKTEYDDGRTDRWDVPRLLTHPIQIIKRTMTAEQIAEAKRAIEQARTMGYTIMQPADELQVVNLLDKPAEHQQRGENGGDGDLSFADIDLYGGLTLKAVAPADPKSLARQCLERHLARQTDPDTVKAIEAAVSEGMPDNPPGEPK